MSSTISEDRRTTPVRRSERVDNASLWRFGVPLLAVFVAAAAIGAVIVTGRPVGLVTRDPNQIAGSPPLAGVLSTLGNGMWAAALGIVVMGVGQAERVRRRAIIVVGTLTGVLYLDDALLLHDVVLPDLGVPGLLINVAYVGVGLGVFAFCFEAMAASRSLAFFLSAGALFAVSMTWDVLDLDLWGKDLLFAVEDGSKFVGIAIWLVGVFMISRPALRPASIRPGPLPGSRDTRRSDTSVDSTDRGMSAGRPSGSRRSR